MTRILPTRNLKKFFHNSNLSFLDVCYDFNRERVILKNKKKHLIDYKDNKFIKSYRKTMIEYERFLEKNKISFLDKDMSISFKRIFNNSKFRQGGRFYSSYQNMKPSERELIKFDNNETCELDFKGLHIQLLYLKEDLGLFQGDPYAIKGYEEYRDIFKVALQIALNAPSKKSAYGGMNQVLRKQDINAKELLSIFMDKHKGISHYFFSGVGLALQYQDSDIVYKVIKKALKAQIMVLPVHDSFIIKKSNLNILYKWLEEICLKTYKTNLPTSLK